MKPEVAAALEASIKHWEENTRVTDLEDARIGTTHCALCAMFYNQGCRGCPVEKRTHMRFCGGSPYQEAEDAAEDGRFEDFIAAAERELEFLKSLREENDGETGE